MSVNSLVDGMPNRNVEADESGRLPMMMGTTRAAREIGIHPALLRREIKRGNIKAVRFGRRKILIPRQSLETFVAGLPDAAPETER